jgi:hypothetical protein
LNVTTIFPRILQLASFVEQGDTFLPLAEISRRAGS